MRCDECGDGNDDNGDYDGEDCFIDNDDDGDCVTSDDSHGDAAADDDNSAKCA